MRPVRYVLVTALLLSLGFLGWLRVRPLPLPLPVVTVTSKVPYQTDLLGEYKRLFRAELRGDTEALEQFAAALPDTYLRYRTLLHLARDAKLPVRKRLGYLEQVFAFNLLSPLARDDQKKAQLTLGRLAEQAGDKRRAAAAYGAALPLGAALRGLNRLGLSPRTRAQIFLDARDPERALVALRGVAAPELRAPALAASGDAARALEVYNRVLVKKPANAAVLAGKFRALLSLGRYRQAKALVPALPNPQEANVRLAEAEADPEMMLTAYLELGDDASLWHAAGLLEARDELAAAIPLYLRVAQGSGDDSEDAAFRAYTLAARLGDEKTAQTADALIPADSFFGLLRGKPFAVPNGRLERVNPPVLALSKALQKAGDPEAALGELLVALPQSRDEPTTIAVAEALQHMGEFSSSTLAANTYLRRGSRARRTYRAAYPRAFAGNVVAQARAHDLRPALLWAVMRQESLFYPRAVSYSGAEGLLQLVPSTWDYVAELLGEKPGDPFDPPANIRYGAFYVAKLLAQFGGSLPESVAAYNGGPGYVSRLLDSPALTSSADVYPNVYPDFYRAITRDETREYVSRVMFNYEVYTQLYGAN